MQRIKISKINNFDINKLNMSRIDSKNKLIYVKYEDSPCIIQLDYLYVYDSLVEVDSKYVSHELLLPLISTTESYTKELCKFFNDLDSKMIDEGRGNIGKWPFNTTGNKYKMIVRNSESDSEVYSNGLLKLKLLKNSNFKTIVYNEEKSILKPEEYKENITNGKFMRIILEISSIWFKNGVYGVYLKPHQIKLSNKQFVVNLLKYSFNESENEEIICDTEVNVQPNELTECKDTELVDLSDSDIIVDSDSTESE